MPEDTTTQQSISDDQELAKVLAGVSTDVDTPVVPAAPPVAEEPAAAPAAPVMADPLAATLSGGDGDDLSSIKTEAITELRPLVDKLNLPPEEKFDTYLLLLRSTDDKTLIAPAHEAAKSIEDEARRAQALLDIIKEIDFLSQGQNQK